jgi:PIN domain nuclease of toxin-antitoxin system/antitoxin (DNA-binding transcriptional repressor) of toxin-antitoxin stability system
MRTVTVHEAKTQFSRLNDAAHAGETILVAKDGKPWARLVPLDTDRPRRQPGLLREQLQLPPIDVLLAPLPPEKLDALDAPVVLLMVPSLLLDTHALLWWLVEPEKLSSLALAAINDPAATISVSAASGWELATKRRLGKRPGAEALLEDWPSLLQQQGFLPLAVQLHHGVHAGGYRQAHRDAHRCAEDCVFLCHESNVLYEH